MAATIALTVVSLLGVYKKVRHSAPCCSQNAHMLSVQSPVVQKAQLSKTCTTAHLNNHCIKVRGSAHRHTAATLVCKTVLTRPLATCKNLFCEQSGMLVTAMAGGLCTSEKAGVLSLE